MSVVSVLASNADNATPLTLVMIEYCIPPLAAEVTLPSATAWCTASRHLTVISWEISAFLVRVLTTSLHISRKRLTLVFGVS
jgi:hypothetical protein